MRWKLETFGSLLIESRIPCSEPNIEKRIRVKLNAKGVEKRPVGTEKEGATTQFIRKAGQFIYGKQNFHKGAFGVIPIELDGFETSADIPSFDVREDCLPEWIYYYFKAGNRFLELTEYARGVGSQRIHPKQLENFEIPLPPLDVQKVIIEELKAIEKNEIELEFTLQLSLVKQLRQAFLREAMQGKLVAQDPQDEPAAQLLAKIKAEKERLIGEKKIKKEKELPPIGAEEVPFEVPEGWVWCRLGEITDFITKGTTPKEFNKDTGIPYLKVYNIVNQSINFEYKPQFVDLKTHNGLLNRSKVYPGDVIMNIVGPPLGKVAIIPNTYPEWNINQALVIFRPLVREINVFLYWYLCFGIEIKNLRVLGVAGQDNLSLEQCRNVIFPLPPLAEQQRIVAKLDELMRYCDALEASIQASRVQNEGLLQQVLREALEPGNGE